MDEKIISLETLAKALTEVVIQLRQQVNLNKVKDYMARIKEGVNKSRFEQYELLKDFSMYLRSFISELVSANYESISYALFYKGFRVILKNRLYLCFIFLVK